jgi:5'-deoxynucleotidase YfbR-like HD superfamily hydrolase
MSDIRGLPRTYQEIIISLEQEIVRLRKELQDLYEEFEQYKKDLI